MHELDEMAATSHVPHKDDKEACVPHNNGGNYSQQRVTQSMLCGSHSVTHHVPHEKCGVLQQSLVEPPHDTKDETVGIQLEFSDNFLSASKGEKKMMKH